ncbi:MAG: sigma-70 family RNA polymerase sigma factor [Kofleriaceae bacterium]
MAAQLPTRAAVEAVWRIEAPRLLGGLMRLVRDVDLAEDLAQEALVAALERWPSTGVPDNPGAWLMTTARNRAIDDGRRRQRQRQKHADLGELTPTATAPDPTAPDDAVGDDVLRLILIACHPILSREARVVLTLRLIAGLTTAEIARAMLASEPTIAQRIVRAKRALRAAQVPFEVPAGDELRDRIAPALEVVYLLFNEGYAATAGDAWLRTELCEEAQRLGRILIGLVPDDAEAHGLLALMELQASRARARVAADGSAVRLLEQDRARWDQRLIGCGLERLTRAAALGRPLGPYTLQAAIAACHARARRAEDTDWDEIVALYDVLLEGTRSPVVALNRAVAVAMAQGPAVALELVDALADDGVLAGYHLLPATRGDLLERLGRRAEAQAAFEAAAELTANRREQALLRARAAACAPRPPPA